MIISVIIPTLGRLEKLRSVLEGMLGCERFGSVVPEVVVVFDGVRESDFLVFEKEYSWVRFYETGKRMGASGARNVGLNKVKGDIVAFLGDDTIPTPNWLQVVYDFHSQYPALERACLGKVAWVPALAHDAFHQWLEDAAQFDFKAIEKRGADWRHFYTSNVSLKRSFIGEDRFSESFLGWGFEDTEFGYRLFKKGLQLVFGPSCEVWHDHRQTLEGMLKNTRSSRVNAQCFEMLHPEIQLLPERRTKWGVPVNWLLRGGLVLSWPLGLVSERMRWWRAWKWAWLGKDEN